MNTPASPQPPAGPSLAVSLTPVAVMLLALVGIVVFCGGNAISTFSPYILLASSAIAVALSAATRSSTPQAMRRGMERSASQILPAVPLLLLIALISTTWLLSGVVPTLVIYGIKFLNPTFFLVTTCAVCAVVSVLTGSSWSTIATIGVAFIGIGKIMGYSEACVAGAIISGAYFGDKVSPLSDTTVIAASSCGVDLFDHIRNLMHTSLPAMIAALAVFLGMGLFATPASEGDTAHIVHALHHTFHITPLTLAIPLVVAVMIALRVRTVVTLAAGSALGVAGIIVFQPHILGQLSAQAGTSPFLTMLGILWSSTSLSTGSEILDSFVATGGLLGMVPTVSLVLCAMLFGAVMLGTGMLATIAAAITRRLSRRGSIVGSTVAGGLFLNSCTADQYLSIIIGSNMFRNVYRQSGLQPRLLSRTLEDSVSVTSVLIPWNSCGVTQSTVLGVATLSYLPYCIFNILSPLFTLLLAWRPRKVHSAISRSIRA